MPNNTYFMYVRLLIQIGWRRSLFLEDIFTLCGMLVTGE
jgi:hypothetical protein